MPDKCPFCEPEQGCVWLAIDSAMVLWDAFPVAKGHTLVVPKPHVASICELSAGDQADLWALVGDARNRLNHDLHPDGFNIGVNDGVAAGQTIPHAHIHIIPRYNGDVADPRGGVCWWREWGSKYSLPSLLVTHASHPKTFAACHPP